MTAGFHRMALELESKKTSRALNPVRQDHSNAFKSSSIASVYSNPMIFFRRIPLRS